MIISSYFEKTFDYDRFLSTIASIRVKFFALITTYYINPTVICANSKEQYEIKEFGTFTNDLLAIRLMITECFAITNFHPLGAISN